jgi:hypothetical protein
MLVGTEVSVVDVAAVSDRRTDSGLWTAAAATGERLKSREGTLQKSAFLRRFWHLPCPGSGEKDVGKGETIARAEPALNP